MSIKGYQAVSNFAVEGRALQAQSLLRCAAALNEARQAPDGDLLVAAAQNNARLWLFFYSEIESGHITLPPEVATNIMTLATYVAKVTVRAMAGEDSVLNALISINRNIAAGLSDSLDTVAAPPPAEGEAVTLGIVTLA